MVKIYSFSPIYKIKIIMTRFYLENGQEVKVGSIIRIESEMNTPFRSIMSTDVRITEDLIPLLVKTGILVVKNDEEVIMESYIKGVARILNMDYSNTSAFLGAMLDHDNFLALYLLLKAASEEAMCGYEGDNCVVIHLHNGKIYTLKNENIPPHVPVFPSVEKANEAIHVLRGLFREVYASKQED